MHARMLQATPASGESLAAAAAAAAALLASGAALDCHTVAAGALLARLRAVDGLEERVADAEGAAAAAAAETAVEALRWLISTRVRLRWPEPRSCFHASVATGASWMGCHACPSLPVAQTGHEFREVRVSCSDEDIPAANVTPSNCY
jgi:hypothetical protein